MTGFTARTTSPAGGVRSAALRRAGNILTGIVVLALLVLTCFGLAQDRASVLSACRAAESSCWLRAKLLSGKHSITRLHENDAKMLGIVPDATWLLAASGPHWARTPEGFRDDKSLARRGNLPEAMFQQIVRERVMSGDNHACFSDDLYLRGESDTFSMVYCKIAGSRTYSVRTSWNVYS